MLKMHIKVTQQWQRHFAAPVALMRTAAATGDILAVDEDAGIYLLNESGTVLLSKQLPWMPAAIALDESASRLAVVSNSGTLLVLDRNASIVDEARIVFRPTGLDLSPTGAKIAFADGNGKVGILDLAARKTEFLDVKASYYYVRFIGPSLDLLALGQYGQVFYDDRANGRQWQKDYRCHTRTPSVASHPITILIPSPYYGVISLNPSGGENGLFEVPDGPKAVAVTADGTRIFAVNEKNELIIFESGGKILFRQSLGVGVLACECGADGQSLVAVMTTGALERFTVGEIRSDKTPFLEFTIERSEGPGAQPAPLWRTKVFSALGGVRGGQVAVTPSARYVALLDVDGFLRIFDQTGKQTAEAERIYGRQGALKASRAADLVIAASSDNLLALDLRGYRQRRLSLKNEWATHFEIAPKGIFFAVADFFRGVSLFDENLERVGYLETTADVIDIAVDGNHHTLLSLSNASIAFYTQNGGLIRQLTSLETAPTAVAALGQGFIVACGGAVEAFDSEGRSAWKLQLPGSVNFIHPTPAGIVIANTEGDAFITNAHGAVTNKMLKHAVAKYFARGGDSKEIIAVEYRGRLLTARSTEAGVLWRRELEDDILTMEISPDGAYVVVIAGIYLCVLSTAAGPKPGPKQLYLEI
jgi:DNA-binding beta-propeller fold protein YncE